MSVEFNELNKSDFCSPTKSYLNDKRQYYNTTIKKKKYINNTDSANQNLLINLLKNFSVKYELNEKYKPYKFVLSFDELISLIRYSLQTQMKLDEYVTDKLDNLNKFSQDFINNLTHYIFSYEKVEKIEHISKNIKDSKYVKSPSNKENYCINTNTGKNNKIISIFNKRSSYWADKKIVKNKQCTKEDNQNNQKKKKKRNSANSNNCMQTSRSFCKRNNEGKIFSPEKNKNKNKENNKNKDKEKADKKIFNRSAERRHNSMKNILSTNNNENSTKKTSSVKARKGKDKKFKTNKNENKGLSIYNACENLASCSFILNKKNLHINCTERNNKKINYESNNNLYHDNKKNDTKTLYYNPNMMLGVKKKIIQNNVPKPSNLANKLLQNGRKYITEFNGIKEEERKKQYF